MLPITYYLFFSLGLFSIGILGFLIRRNALIMFMCIELMLNAVNILLVAFSKMHAQQNPLSQNGIEGQIFVFFIMVVAAAEVAVGLSIIILLFRKTRNLNVNLLNKLKN